jgi:hypothetical protein
LTAGSRRAHDGAGETGHGDRSMKGLLVMACAGLVSAPGGLPSNVAPLAFGMTPQQVAEVLHTPLTHVAGRPGNEIYVAVTSARVPGFYPVGRRVHLQFRRGCLTGWKNDWDMRSFF